MGNSGDDAIPDPEIVQPRFSVHSAIWLVKSISLALDTLCSVQVTNLPAAALSHQCTPDLAFPDYQPIPAHD
jgi:hypothetical protein